MPPRKMAQHVEEPPRNTTGGSAADTYIGGAVREPERRKAVAIAVRTAVTRITAHIERPAARRLAAAAAGIMLLRCY